MKKLEKTIFCNLSHQSTEKGFSLVEMMISMAVFLMVTATTYGLLTVGLFDKNRANRRAEVTKNARLGIQLIGRDVLNAGLGYNRSGAKVPDDFLSKHLGTTADGDLDRDTLTAISGGNNLFINVLEPANRTDTIALAYRDTGFNGGNLVGITDAQTVSGDDAKAQTQNGAPNNAAQVRPFDLLLLESNKSQFAAMATGANNNSIDFSLGDDSKLGINQSMSAGGSAASLLRKCTVVIVDDCTTYVDNKTSVISAKRFNWVSYRVNADGTLVRIVYGNNPDGTKDEQIQELPIANNVSDLQFKYVMDDGTTTDDPFSWKGNKQSNFNLVRQVIVTIKVVSPDLDEQTKKPDTITLEATFSTRNIEYDAG